MTFPPFRKGGVRGDFHRVPQSILHLLYCILWDANYTGICASSNVFLHRLCLPKSPSFLLYERGRFQSLQLLPHPQKLTNHKPPFQAPPYNWVGLSKSTTPARCHPAIIRQRRLYSLSLWGEG